MGSCICAFPQEAVSRHKRTQVCIAEDWSSHQTSALPARPSAQRVHLVPGAARDTQYPRGQGEAELGKTPAVA